MAKRKNKKWFIAVRGSYLPNSWQGWLLYIPFVAYLIWALVIGINDTSTYATAALFVVPNWIAATVVMTWIAKIKS